MIPNKAQVWYPVDPEQHDYELPDFTEDDGDDTEPSKDKQQEEH